MTPKGIGLDFGTTNSAITVAYADGSLRLARFTEADRLTDTFRSILYFFHPQDPESDSRYAAAGPEAIGAYLSAEPRGRLIQSAKSFLASRSFKQTAIYRSLYTLEDLIAIIAAELRSAAQDQFGEIPSTVVAGRPVRFSGARTEADDEFAIEVDSVFMTGGTSFVPAVRLLFAEKFGADKLRGGGELTSVAEGLALRALSLNKQAL
jgi:hypothetical chaperone protein